jgi:hypothetical protein
LKEKVARLEEELQIERERANSLRQSFVSDSRIIETHDRSVETDGSWMMVHEPEESVAMPVSKKPALWRSFLWISLFPCLYIWFHYGSPGFSKRILSIALTWVDELFQDQAVDMVLM